MRELTDSYCERCGTRYTFGPSPPKGPSLAGARLLAKGLKNFVMTDGTSMDEAMAAARIDATKTILARDRGVPPDLQLLHDLPPVRLRQVLEREPGCVPVLRAAVGPGAGRSPGHLIIRAPVLRPDLGDIGEAPSLADVRQAPRALQMPCRGPTRIRCPGGPPLARAARAPPLETGTNRPRSAKRAPAAGSDARARRAARARSPAGPPGVLEEER